MNSRVRELCRSSPESDRSEPYYKYLKPGALARIRDSRISARSNRVKLISRICLNRTSSIPSSPNNAGQPQVIMVDEDFPCFVGRVNGPRCPQRKKLFAAKSAWFPISSPTRSASPLSPDPIDVYNSDSVAAY